MKRVLVIKHGSLGDIVFSLPVMHSIYTHYLNASIDLDARIDSLGHTWQVRSQGNHKRNRSSPVGSSRVVPVPSMPSVQTWHINFLILNNPIIGSQDRSNRRQENRQPAHERQQALSTRDNLPRHHGPASRHSRDDCTSSDIDILRTQVHHIVRAGNNVRRQIRPDLCHDPTETHEESTAPSPGSVPVRREVKRRPDIFSVDDFCAAS